MKTKDPNAVDGVAVKPTVDESNRRCSRRSAITTFVPVVAVRALRASLRRAVDAPNLYPLSASLVPSDFKNLSYEARVAGVIACDIQLSSITPFDLRNHDLNVISQCPQCGGQRHPLKLATAHSVH
ncbi:MAG TPA: hypothetical protein VK548_23075 [Candidatus Acidoferrum sp.]|nr:hypothetical protein [Candidatus Acidoferrum sp.]